MRKGVGGGWRPFIDKPAGELVCIYHEFYQVGFPLEISLQYASHLGGIIASQQGDIAAQGLRLREKSDLLLKAMQERKALEKLKERRQDEHRKEAGKLAYADRYEFLGDTDFIKAPLKGFTSKAYGAEQARKIDPEKAKPAKDLRGGDPWKYESPSTTHFSVADAGGNAVSTTYTLGADFGSGVMPAGTGFLLNNQMNNYSHEQTVKALEKAKPLPLNAMAPGKRMLSTMMPSNSSVPMATTSQRIGSSRLDARPCGQ